MYAVPAAPGPDHRRDLRHDAAHHAPARGTGAPSPAKSEIMSGWLEPGIDARAARVDEPHHRPAPAQRHLSGGA